MQFNPDAVTRVASVNGEQTRVITIYIESAYPGGSRLAHDARVVEKRVAISAAEVLVVLSSKEHTCELQDHSDVTYRVVLNHQVARTRPVDRARVRQHPVNVTGG